MRKFNLIVFIVVIFFASSCFKKNYVPEFAKQLQSKFQNEIYESFDSLVYDSVFKLTMKNTLKEGRFSKVIVRLYQKNQYKPVVFLNFLRENQLQIFGDSLQNIETHGFSQANFSLEKIKDGVEKIQNYQFKKIDSLYHFIARTELYLSESYLKYFVFMQYGCINPLKVMSRYRVPVHQLTDEAMVKLLENKDVSAVLKSAYPANPDYRILQKEYSGQKEKGNTELVRKLLINMERARWKIPKLNSERVEVNIPAFRLNWIKGDSVLAEMNVCVGETIESDYNTKMVEYLKTKDINQKPQNHQTSVLLSSIRSIQVNPVWNIPPSIAKREIYRRAIGDRYYLANANIKVYKNGKFISNPDTIQWQNYSQDKLPFVFKQDPGAGNALGKFKFIFANNDGLYLHDTNVKSAFSKENRAVSHGCIRIQDPLKFAELLSGDQKLYDRLRIAVDLMPTDTTGYSMQLYKKHLEAKTDTVNRYVLKPVTYLAKRPVQLYVKYQTAYISDTDKVMYVPDVYGFDALLWDKLKKYTK